MLVSVGIEIAQVFSYYSLVLLFSELPGTLKSAMAEGKYKWDRPFVNRKPDCQIHTKCCVPFLAHGGKDPLDVPNGAYVTADIRYTDTDGGFDPPEGSVTVEHYHPVDEHTDYYFYMDREYTGHYYDQINWQGNEIADHGQKLAVCVKQDDVLPQGRTIYTVITYADINMGRA